VDHERAAAQLGRQAHGNGDIAAGGEDNHSTSTALPLAESLACSVRTAVRAGYVWFAHPAPVTIRRKGRSGLFMRLRIRRHDAQRGWGADLADDTSHGRVAPIRCRHGTLPKCRRPRSADIVDDENARPPPKGWAGGCLNYIATYGRSA
jgi:hypothetical protein